MKKMVTGKSLLKKYFFFLLSPANFRLGAEKKVFEREKTGKVFRRRVGKLLVAKVFPHEDRSVTGTLYLPLAKKEKHC